MEQDGVSLEYNNSREESSSWLAGFADIFTQPSALAGIDIRRHIGKIFAVGILLYTLGTSFLNFMYSASVGIRDENYTMASRSIEMASKKQQVAETELEAARQQIRDSLNFSFVKSLGFGLLIGAMALSLSAAVFWVAHRLFTDLPAHYVQVLGLSSYGNAIALAGSIITGIAQYFGNSLASAPNLGVLVSPLEHSFLFSFLSRINIFTLWEYMAVAIALTALTGIERSKAYIIGALAFLIMLIPYAIQTWLGWLMVS